MTPALPDHVLVALMVLVDPLIAKWAYRRMTATLAAGNDRARVRGFRWTIGLQVVGAVVILVLWAVFDRPMKALVSVAWLPEGWWTWFTWGLVLVACAGLIAQVMAIRGNEAELATVRKQMTSVEGILPRTAAELKLFLGISLAAGVCEEIAYRGYLLAYFDSLVGPALAVLTSTVIFGLGHAYQGAGGVVKTAIAGLVYAAAYVGTGSLLAPMLLHATTDASSGIVAYWALRALGGQRP